MLAHLKNTLYMSHLGPGNWKSRPKMGQQWTNFFLQKSDRCVLCVWPLSGHSNYIRKKDWVNVRALSVSNMFLLLFFKINILCFILLFCSISKCLCCESSNCWHWKEASKWQYQLTSFQREVGPCVISICEFSDFFKCPHRSHWKVPLCSNCWHQWRKPANGTAN